MIVKAKKIFKAGEVLEDSQKSSAQPSVAPKERDDAGITVLLTSLENTLSDGTDPTNNSKKTSLHKYPSFQTQYFLAKTLKHRYSGDKYAKKEND